MDTNIKDVKLGVVGCGKMASAILGGVVNNKFLSPENINIYDVNMEASGLLCKNYGFSETYSLEELVKKSDVILLAVKPFIYYEVLSDIKQFYENQPILSILAGVSIEKINAILLNAPIIRIMPNTPALVNAGMSALCRNNYVDDCWFDFAKKLMDNCGKTIVIDEDKIDIVTALSGSGPAFYFKIIELMAKSAQKLGLNYNDAILLSSQTALGSAKMLLENDFDVNQLIANVTTPGGCTEVGNNIINNSNINLIFDEMIQKTMQKAKELG